MDVFMNLDMLHWTRIFAEDCLNSIELIGV